MRTLLLSWAQVSRCDHHPPHRHRGLLHPRQVQGGLHMITMPCSIATALRSTVPVGLRATNGLPTSSNEHRHAVAAANLTVCALAFCRRDATGQGQHPHWQHWAGPRLRVPRGLCAAPHVRRVSPRGLQYVALRWHAFWWTRSHAWRVQWATACAAPSWPPGCATCSAG